ncbi:unnamed protein product [Paramecium sonneborni]|uniref:START domain-containing protein n=1 Tax=Paramecium sonneborni TaxID=65129 RepID=A0A8S1PIN9_9CILI|nr:unnamed protein product [Paramecium sonneborni]
MGNINVCCNSREDHPPQNHQNKQKHQQDTEESEYEPNTEAYRKTIQSVIISKPSLTFGEQMIQDIIDLTDENKVPLTSENGWNNLINQQFVKLFAFEWKKAEKSIVIVLRAEFQLNCIMQSYINIALDDMKLIDKKIEELNIIEENTEHNESIRYIAHKGIGVLKSRDFLYLKSQQKISEKLYIEAAKSIEDQSGYPEKKRTRGQINLAGQIVEQINPQVLLIKQFLDVDMKTNVQLVTLKNPIIKEFLKYHESLQNYFNLQQ